MEEALEIYHQKGGTYVIPVEIMNYWIGEYEEQKKLNEEHQRINGELRSCNSKAYDWVIKYQTEWCQNDEVISDLSQLKEILQSKEGR